MSNSVDAIYLGLEASNGYCKAASNLTSTVDSYLNTLTIVDKDVYNANKGDNGVANGVYEVVTGVNRIPQYFKVGQSITNLDEQVYFSDDDKLKYSDPNWIIANMILIYRQIQEREVGVPIFVVTGLPTNHSQDEDLKNEIIEALSQRFLINGRSIQLSGVSIIPQGDGSFYNDLIDSSTGEFNKEFLKVTAPEDEDQQSVISYIDIGFGTTDIKTVIDYTVSSKFKKELSGMEKQWIDILQKATSKNSEFAGVEVLAVEKQLRKGGELKFDREKVNVSQEWSDTLQKFAASIVGALTKAPFKGLTFNQIRFVGGGSIVLEPMIREFLNEKYKKNTDHLEKFVFVPNPQFANCNGFQKMCQRKYSKVRV
ncbi:ParM/StbA family protein [Bacillus massiliigorillae]|uniref:ParM/StbA family protein n=1 Tax=Bacillus massiliigorillae TaxID=1243664 RepID=UPI00039DE713|nr:ParM/StbA family protein [Bacillus massiliigorillae]